MDFYACEPFFLQHEEGADETHLDWSLWPVEDRMRRLLMEVAALSLDSMASAGGEMECAVELIFDAISIIEGEVFTNEDILGKGGSVGGNSR